MAALAALAAAAAATGRQVATGCACLNERVREGRRRTRMGVMNPSARLTWHRSGRSGRGFVSGPRTSTATKRQHRTRASVGVVNFYRKAAQKNQGGKTVILLTPLLMKRLLKGGGRGNKMTVSPMATHGVSDGPEAASVFAAHFPRGQADAHALQRLRDRHCHTHSDRSYHQTTSSASLNKVADQHCNTVLEHDAGPSATHTTRAVFSEKC